MTIETNSIPEINKLKKTIKYDRRIQKFSVPIAVLWATWGICLNPLVAIPSTLASTTVFLIAGYRLKVNQEKLNNITK